MSVSSTLRRSSSRNCSSEFFSSFLLGSLRIILGEGCISSGTSPRTGTGVEFELENFTEISQFAEYLTVLQIPYKHCHPLFSLEKKFHVAFRDPQRLLKIEFGQSMTKTNHQHQFLRLLIYVQKLCFLLSWRYLEVPAIFFSPPLLVHKQIRRSVNIVMNDHWKNWL